MLEVRCQMQDLKKETRQVSPNRLLYISYSLSLLVSSSPYRIARHQLLLGGL